MYIQDQTRVIFLHFCHFSLLDNSRIGSQSVTFDVRAGGFYTLGSNDEHLADFAP